MSARVSLSHAWRAPRHRNFKVFFFAQSISVIGNRMTRLATSWLVYRMSHSVLLLGVVSFSGQIVPLLPGPFAYFCPFLRARCLTAVPIRWAG